MRRWVLLMPIATGCGLVSGLDSLEIDGGDDAALADAAMIDSPSGMDVVTIEGGATDASPDCHYAASPRCFGSTCAGDQVCCITDAAACTSSLACGGVSLGCTDPDNCVDAGGSCCLHTYTLTTGMCPAVVNVMSGTKSVCSAPCLTGADHLCTGDKDCNGNACQMVTLSSDPSITFGLCVK